MSWTNVGPGKALAWCGGDCWRDGLCGPNTALQSRSQWTETWRGGGGPVSFLKWAPPTASWLLHSMWVCLLVSILPRRHDFLRFFFPLFNFQFFFSIVGQIKSVEDDMSLFLSQNFVYIYDELWINTHNCIILISIIPILF